MPPPSSRSSGRPCRYVVALATAVLVASVLAACAPITGAGDEAGVGELAAAAADPSTGRVGGSDTAPAGTGADNLDDDVAEAARVAARAEAASDVARSAARVGASRLAADVTAASRAVRAVAEREAAEEAAREKAAEEAARKKAAEEAARKKAEEEAREARELQTALADLGYYEGGIDGDVGPLTEAAVEAFQEVNGLEVDGVVGPQTEAALASDDALPKPPPPAPDSDESDSDESGSDESDGDASGLPDGVLAVEVAQQGLADLGYYLGPVDGEKSEALAHALQAFQLVNGITADGILGPGTSDALRDPVAPSLVGGASTRIEIDLDRQVMHLVKGDERVRTMPTSSGSGEQYLTSDGGTANATTPVGTFTIQRRISGKRVADLGTLYDPMYFYRGWAIHGSNSVPPYPASHGCTRLPRADALWLWDQVDNGTQVVIHGGEHTFIPTA